MLCVLTTVFVCRHMKREGTIAFNGQLSTKRLKRNIGFVMQVERISAFACQVLS